MIENKYTKNENPNKKNEYDINNQNQQKKIYTKNNTLAKSNQKIKNNLQINNRVNNNKKNLFIETDFKGNKKYKKSINSFSDKINKNNEKSNNKNILKESNRENKEKENEKEDNIKNQNEDSSMINKEDKILEENNNKRKNQNDLYVKFSYYSSIISPNNNIISKNISLNNTGNKFNSIIFPISRENSTTYIRKRSSNMNINCNGNNNFSSDANKGTVFKHKKNYSISQSCYNTQRNSKDNRIITKNRNNKSNNYLFSPKNNKIENNNIVIPEYKIKLEKIKSRINNLLNIYSLLALKNINIININTNNKEIEEEEDINSNNNEYCF